MTFDHTDPGFIEGWLEWEAEKAQRALESYREQKANQNTKDEDHENPKIS